MTTAAVALVVGTLYAQQHPAEDQQAAKPAAKAEAPEIFCASMKTGALCPTGTVSSLHLSGQKQDQWLDAVQRYNKAIEDANKQLHADAKDVLTPAQIAQVDKWFAVGVNTQLNQLLASAK
jgi:hypothetical protein